MKFGAYTACLHDKTLPEALAILAGLGLDSAEINSGGFIPEPHLPIADLMGIEGARQDYLAQFAAHGITLTALNCNGNPLDANAARRQKHSADLFRSIELAPLIGVNRVVTMSGTPGAGPSSTLPAWNVMPWDSAYLDVRDYQWNEVAIPFWREVQERAAATTSRSRSRCTRTTWSTTRPRRNGWSPRSTPPTSAPSSTRATSSGRASSRSRP
jgi:sugar phosphate isomerase/epimerase